jgi:hypothetical protein
MPSGTSGDHLTPVFWLGSHCNFETNHVLGVVWLGSKISFEP